MLVGGKRSKGGEGIFGTGKVWWVGSESKCELTGAEKRFLVGVGGWCGFLHLWWRGRCVDVKWRLGFVSMLIGDREVGERRRDIWL